MSACRVVVRVDELVRLDSATQLLDTEICDPDLATTNNNVRHDDIVRRGRTADTRVSVSQRKAGRRSIT